MRDTESVLAQAVVPRIEAAVAQVGSDPRLAAFVGRDDLFGLARRLAAWDRRCTREQEGPVLFMGVTWFAARRVFEPALTRSLFSGITTRSPPYVLGFLKNAVERRFPDAERFLPDGEALVWLQALDDTRAWLAQRFGATPPRYGDLFFAQFANGYGGALVPPLVPVDGCNDTIFVAEAALLDEDAAPRQQVTTRMMSLYRMVMSFDDDGVPYSTLNFSRGTRGDPGGPFFDDQQARWLSGEHVRLPFRKPDVEASATERHLLE
jgi:penicillin amidase